MEKTPNEKHDFEILTPKEFTHRLGIAKSTLQQWRVNGWLLPRRHYVKYSEKFVRYFWSEDRLIEIHDLCNREKESPKTKPPKTKPVTANRPPKRGGGPRVNWDY